MIVPEQKPLGETKQIVSGDSKVLDLGCGTCVTICFAGGEKQVVSWPPLGERAVLSILARAWGPGLRSR